MQSYIEVQDKEKKITICTIECSHNIEELPGGVLLCVIEGITKIILARESISSCEFKILVNGDDEEIVFTFKVSTFSSFGFAFIEAIECLRDYAVVNTLIKTGEMKRRGDFKAASDLFFEEQTTIDGIANCFEALKTIAKNVEVGLH